MTPAKHILEILEKAAHGDYEIAPNTTSFKSLISWAREAAAAEQPAPPTGPALERYNANLAELEKLRGFYAEIVKTIGHDRVLNDLAARDALIAELRLVAENARELYVKAACSDAAATISTILARTPADAGAELARLRRDRHELEQSLKGANSTSKSILDRAYAESDALRAQLASAEARVRELESEAAHEERVKQRIIDLAHADRLKLEARLRDVTEAGDDVCSEYELVLNSVERHGRRFPRSHVMLAKFYAARSGDLPSASVTVIRPHPESVADAERALAGAVAMEDPGLVSYAQEQLVKAKGGDLPPHPDEERMDFLQTLDCDSPLWQSLADSMFIRQAIDAARAKAGGAK